jgi:hypothetical protein
MRVPSRTSTDRAQVEGQSCGQTEACMTLTMPVSVSKERLVLQWWRAPGTRRHGFRFG